MAANDRSGLSAADGERDWDRLFAELLLRSGGRCEIRSTWCLAGPRGDLSALPRDRVSIHHRLPRRAGGTLRPEVNELPNLVAACGSGTAGCHGWVESYRTAGYARGLLLHDGADPAAEPIELHGGMRVSVAGPWYVTVGWAA